jgi:hypothetical protein
VLTLLCLASTLGFVPVTLAQQDQPSVPGSRGVAATITIIDAKTGMAILKTEAGEMFEVLKSRLWKVGDKVLCDQIDEVPSRLRFRRCRLWR